MKPNDSKSTMLIEVSSLSVRRNLESLMLRVVDGPDTGRTCALSKQIICVGSDPAANLVLADGTVSRRHLLAKKDEEGVWIQDQDSTNGTFFEGSKVREMIIGPGTTIRVGQTLIKVVPKEENLHPEPLKENHFHGVIGENLGMREIFATLADVADTNLTVLIEGETGTGKEALAEALHQASPRNSGPFVVVDCTAIPSDLAESELFGHRKGAFTGAIANRAGSFEQAHQGTIFIDEVGDLIKELQPKLLRVLERRRFNAATHKNLKDEVSRGNFREDLYYRLAVISLRIPPLRDRCDDLPRLAEHFIKLASDGKQAIEIPG
ncbi:MAG: sigma 54-dependent Fis family transcriptional regulator [Deltaproteobacteria bacterium]|nr:sigma 54-dependent Fis family transcriptional regulator [Deltaproteobacteria bacterium]